MGMKGKETCGCREREREAELNNDGLWISQYAIKQGEQKLGLVIVWCTY